jgi:hypothetical protein
VTGEGVFEVVGENVKTKILVGIKVVVEVDTPVALEVWGFHDEIWTGFGARATHDEWFFFEFW